jgi:hypothetical protein
LAYSFHGEGLLIDGFATTILSGFPRPFYPSREFWNRLNNEKIKNEIIKCDLFGIDFEKTRIN